MLFRNTAGYIDASMVVIASGAALAAGTVQAFVQRTSDSKWLNLDGTWTVGVPVGGAIPVMTHVSGGGWKLAHTPADADDTYFINCIDSPVTCYPDNYEITVLGVGAKDSTVARESTLASVASYIDTEITRILGLVLHNHVEDDIVRDANGLKTSATIYLYDSAANATTHDKVTGVIGKYTVTPVFTSQLMSSLKSVQVI